jgi:hypothetical protein
MARHDRFWPGRGTCTLMLLAWTGAGAGAPPSAAPAATPPSAPVPPDATGSEEAVKQFVPEFLAGLWEYRLTRSAGEGGESQTSVTRHCGSPSDEIRQNLINIERKGCRFSQRTHHGNRYESSWTCATSGATATFRSVLTVTSNHTYHDESEVRRGQQVIYSTTIAIRVGACPAPSPAPAAPSNR